MYNFVAICMESKRRMIDWGSPVELKSKIGIQTVFRELLGERSFFYLLFVEEKNGHGRKMEKSLAKYAGNNSLFAITIPANIFYTA